MLNLAFGTVTSAPRGREIVHTVKNHLKVFVWLSWDAVIKDTSNVLELGSLMKTSQVVHHAERRSFNMKSRLSCNEIVLTLVSTLEILCVNI